MNGKDKLNINTILETTHMYLLLSQQLTHTCFTSVSIGNRPWIIQNFVCLAARALEERMTDSFSPGVIYFQESNRVSWIEKCDWFEINSSCCSWTCQNGRAKKERLLKNSHIDVS